MICDDPVERVVRVADGDTQIIRLDLGYRIYPEITARIEKVDCPEIDTVAGKLVAEYVDRRLREVSKLRWISRSLDQWKRSVGEFYWMENNTTVFFGSELLAKRFAKPFREKRTPWTAEELAAVEKLFR